ncbi:glycosyltransferase [Photobacterium carnosum]|uniref:glycosyltransferase n=2 Tax=Photobacterium carnosum TaxID=2023717 RepID=UPI00128E5411|nr:glycosyltransferase [Photobacterium carnosum]KAE8176841.1 hypothetical protein CIT27_10845 [Photobacterium carnosum]MCD9494661.1 glycosyltransferase [Photobacterium carnosum]MCD9514613.1 glycosyltransferase [Photobacterium carnosum]MCD9522228.1 glycosyltransferase [Photobacterium carnosum]MCD9526326.1 glycosyltransferase [Photobacterium carnosum]
MKRILFITHNFKGGGIQKITLDTARYLAQQGNDITLLALEEGLDFQLDFQCAYNVLPVKEFLYKHPFLGFYFLFYKIFLRKIFPQSEHLWAGTVYKKVFMEYYKNQQPFDAIFINGARSMNRLHSINLSQAVYSLHLPHVLAKKDNVYYNFLFKKLFLNKKVFTVSDFIKDPILKKSIQLSIPLKCLETIYNPCDKTDLLEKSKDEINFNGKFILAVGRLSRQKRFDILIDAYHLADINLPLIILGEGNQRKALEKKIDQLNLNKKIFLKGFDENPFKWMNRCEFFVLSSDLEGFVLVINEALACGAPIIATDCGPVTEILTGELQQGIVPKQDPIALANKIKQFIDNPIYPSEDVIDKLSFSYITESQIKLALQ